MQRNNPGQPKPSADIHLQAAQKTAATLGLIALGAQQPDSTLSVFPPDVITVIGLTFFAKTHEQLRIEAAKAAAAQQERNVWQTRQEARKLDNKHHGF